MRVYKDHWDWVAYCSEHDDTTWTGDWGMAMEAAWGHIAMHHPRVYSLADSNLDTSPSSGEHQ